MPGIYRSDRRLDHVGGLLRDDSRFYRMAINEKQRAVVGLHCDRAMAHKYLWAQLKNSPSYTAIRTYAEQLEAQGLYAEAADAYYQLLSQPRFNQGDNQELRAHVMHLFGKVNKQQAEQDARQRVEALQEEGRLAGGRPKGLHPLQTPAAPVSPRGDNGVNKPISTQPHKGPSACAAAATLQPHANGAGAAAGSPRLRPASAGAGVAVRERERELDRNNAANFARQYVPGHPYAAPAAPAGAAAGPVRASMPAWPPVHCAAGAPGAAVAGGGGSPRLHFADPGPRPSVAEGLMQAKQAWVEQHWRPVKPWKPQ